MARDTDLSALEQALLAEISGAGDLRALEEVRVAALGRKGRVSELMARRMRNILERSTTMAAAYMTWGTVLRSGCASHFRRSGPRRVFVAAASASRGNLHGRPRGGEDAMPGDGRVS